MIWILKRLGCDILLFLFFFLLWFCLFFLTNNINIFFFLFFRTAWQIFSFFWSLFRISFLLIIFNYRRCFEISIDIYWRFLNWHLDFWVRLLGFRLIFAIQLVWNTQVNVSQPHKIIQASNFIVWWTLILQLWFRLIIYRAQWWVCSLILFDSFL